MLNNIWQADGQYHHLDTQECVAQPDLWTSIRHICDQFVLWQAPGGGFDVGACPYHRETPFGRPSDASSLAYG